MSPAGCKKYEMEIANADTDGERTAVRNFLAQHIKGIAPNAVPSLENDNFYRPLVPWLRDDTGTVIGAALTCRSQFAAGAAMLARSGARIPPEAIRYLPVLDKHSELDLLAVRPDHRGNGLGSQLLHWMESRLRSMGVRVWFGNATKSLAVDDVRRFYTRNGFSVTGAGESLPPLLGRTWVPPYAEPPAFFFYKVLPALTT